MNTKELRESLLKKNILYLEGDVGVEMVEYVGQSMAEFMSRNAPPITVYITSGGGGVTSGLDIYDMLAVYPNVKSGVVVRCAKSIAAVILQACTTRQALEHSRILIHNVVTHDVTLDTMRSQKKKTKVLRDMEEDQARLYKILSIRTHKSAREIKRACSKKDGNMSAREAIEFGLLDGVVEHWKLDPTLPDTKTT